MARKDIRVPLDRQNRNNHNDNYTQLFEGVQQVKKTIDDLVLESGGDSNLEVVQARGGENTLNSRLDKLDDKDNELTSQLAETEQHLDDKKMDKNTTDIGINQINKNKGKIDETYLSEELLQQMAGDTPIHSVPANKSITNAKIAEKAVSPTGTTFARLGKNKFDGVYVRGNISGGVDTARWDESLQGLSAIVKVKPNSNYAISKSGGDRFRLAGSVNYTKDGDELEGYQWVDSQDSTALITGDVNYLVIWVSTSTANEAPEWMQVEEGSNVTPYDVSRILVDLEEESVSS